MLSLMLRKEEKKTLKLSVDVLGLLMRTETKLIKYLPPTTDDKRNR
jgi:hypothetical protein